MLDAVPRLRGVSVRRIHAGVTVGRYHVALVPGGSHVTLHAHHMV